ncbi:hypothetical protein FQN54_003000 [Arachnomyces sp. PD_36]|nr:hypothetical protein FQN54_003000 [Arachnomyces sp. PD_36]
MAVKNQPMPTIENPNDVVIRITTSAICGTDLHTYRGLVGSPNPPWIMGHEGVGVIVQVGSGVKTLDIGDRVVYGNISCGYCDNCLRGRNTYCLTYDPSTTVDEGGFGSVLGHDLGGAQAEYARLPFADSSCFLLPPDTKHELDYVLVSDIFATGWHAVDLSGFKIGDTVAVFGAGPVGLLCAYSAVLRGASKVYSVDYVPSRLKKAASIGAIPIDFTESDPVKQILAHEPRGVRRSCDCVGFESLNSRLDREPGIVFRNCIEVTEPTGGIGLIGEYPPLTDGPTPGAPLSTGKEGVFPVPIGTLWNKSIDVGDGVVEMKVLQPILRDLIESGRAKPSFVIDTVAHSLHEVPDLYAKFEKRQIQKPVIQLSYDNDGDSFMPVNGA